MFVLKKDELPQGFDSSKYCIQRLEADNQGVKIPITVFFHKDYEISAARPLYITGYGSYRFGLSAGFSMLLSKREDTVLLMGRQPRLARAASSSLCSNAASSA